MKIKFLFSFLIILILTMGAVSAEDLDNSLSEGMDNALDTTPVLMESDETSTDTGLLAGDENGEIFDSSLKNAESPVLEDDDDVTIVNDWNELQYYTMRWM